MSDLGLTLEDIVFFSHICKPPPGRYYRVILWNGEVFGHGVIESIPTVLKGCFVPVALGMRVERLESRVQGVHPAPGIEAVRQGSRAFLQNKFQ